MDKLHLCHVIDLNCLVIYFLVQVILHEFLLVLPLLVFLYISHVSLGISQAGMLPFMAPLFAVISAGRD